MAKKKAKSMVGLIMICCACILGLAAIFMMFAPGVVSTGKLMGSEGPTYTGAQTAFGYKETNGNITAEILKPNGLAMLGYLLPIAGIVIAALFRKSRLFGFISAGVFIASAICMFLSMTAFPATLPAGQETIYTYKMGIGTIISGICSALAGVIMLCKIVLKR